MSRILIISFLILFIACKTDPQKINYGEDECHFCAMKVMDRQYAAELVTSKGKAFKFDAIECMVNFKLQDFENNYAHMLVNVYTKPGELVEAETCSYLISESMPSPMGANLTAFETMRTATEFMLKEGGNIYSWTELILKFEKK